MRFATLFTLVAFLSSSVASAQDTSALINEQLDKPISKLELTGTLPQVMKTIGEQTGVRLEASAAVWDLLPWGQGTYINAKIENQTLRQALEAISRRLGLTFVLKDESVELRPLPALRRLGKRATVQELAALDQLASTPLGLSGNRASVTQLIEAIDQKLVEIKSSYAVENRAGESAKPDQAIAIPRNATLLDALEAIAASTGATWYPWGKSIVLVPKEDQVRTQLLKTISIRYSGTDVAQVLLELSQKAGVNFEIQPGVIQGIAPEFRNIRLILDNATIKQALDTIGGFTGLAWAVNDKGVYIWSSTPAGTQGRDPAIGLIPLDNGIQIVVPQSQVPPDLREYVKYRTQKELQKLRRMMQEENFRPPATAPATQPNRDL